MSWLAACGLQKLVCLIELNTGRAEALHEGLVRCVGTLEVGIISECSTVCATLQGLQCVVRASERRGEKSSLGVPFQRVDVFAAPLSACRFLRVCGPAFLWYAPHAWLARLLLAASDELPLYVCCAYITVRIDTKCLMHMAEML